MNKRLRGFFAVLFVALPALFCSVALRAAPGPAITFAAPAQVYFSPGEPVGFEVRLNRGASTNSEIQFRVFQRPDGCFTNGASRFDQRFSFAPQEISKTITVSNLTTCNSATYLNLESDHAAVEGPALFLTERAQVSLCCTNVPTFAGIFQTELTVRGIDWPEDIVATAEVKSREGTILGEVSTVIRWPARTGLLHFANRSLTNGGTIAITSLRPNPGAELSGILSAELVPAAPTPVGFCCGEATVDVDGRVVIPLKAEGPAPLPITVVGEVRMPSGQLLATNVATMTNGTGQMIFQNAALLDGGTVTLTRVVETLFARPGGILSVRLVPAPRIVIGLCCNEIQALPNGNVTVPLRVDRRIQSWVLVEGEVRASDGRVLSTSTARIFDGSGAIDFNHVPFTNGATLALTKVIEGPGQLGGILMAALTPVPPLTVELCCNEARVQPDRRVAIQLRSDRAVSSRVTVEGELRLPTGETIATASTILSQGFGWLYFQDVPDEGTIILTRVLEGAARIGITNTARLVPEPPLNVGLCCSEVLVGPGGEIVVPLQLDRNPNYSFVAAAQVRSASGELLGTTHSEVNMGAWEFRFRHSALTNGGSITLTGFVGQVRGNLTGYLSASLVFAPQVVVSLCCSEVPVQSPGRADIHVQSDRPVQLPIIVAAELRLPNGTLLSTNRGVIMQGHGNFHLEHPLLTNGATLTLTHLGNSPFARLGGIITTRLFLPPPPIAAFSTPEGTIQSDGSILIELHLKDAWFQAGFPNFTQVELRQVSGDRRDENGDHLPPFSDTVYFSPGSLVRDVYVSGLASDATFSLSSRSALIGATSNFTARLSGLPAFGIEGAYVARGETARLRVARIDRRVDQGHTLRAITADGTARAGVDYYHRDISIPFGPGERQKEIEIETLLSASAGTSFTVSLLGDGAAAAIPDGRVATVRILPRIGFDSDRYMLDPGNRLRGSLVLDAPISNRYEARILDLNRGVYFGSVTIPAGERKADFDFSLSAESWLTTIGFEAVSEVLNWTNVQAQVVPSGWQEDSVLLNIWAPDAIGEGESASLYIGGDIHISVTLNVRTVDLTATADADYRRLDTNVTLQPGQGVELFLHALSDDLAEGTENIGLLITSISGSIFVIGKTNVLIRGTSPPRELAIHPGPFASFSEEQVARFTVDERVPSFRYFTTDLSARAGVDYEPLNGTSTNGDPREFEIPIKDNPALSPLREFQFTIVTDEPTPRSNSVRVAIIDNELADWQDPLFDPDSRLTVPSCLAVRADDSILMVHDGELLLLDRNGQPLQTNQLNLPLPESGEPPVASMAVFANNDILMIVRDVSRAGVSNLRLLRSDGTFDGSFNPDLPDGRITSIQITPAAKILLTVLRLSNGLEVHLLNRDGTPVSGFEVLEFPTARQSGRAFLLPTGNLEIAYNEEEPCPDGVFFPPGGRFWGCFRSRAHLVHDAELLPGDPSIIARDARGNGYRNNYLARIRADGSADPAIPSNIFADFLGVQSDGKTLVSFYDNSAGRSLFRRVLPLSQAAATKLFLASYQDYEWSSQRSVKVSRTGETSDPLTVEIQTLDGTALAGRDYHATNLQLQFAPLQTVTNFHVRIIDDSTPEPLEGFQVSARFRSPEGNIFTIQSDIKIHDNDPPAHLELQRTRAGILVLHFQQWNSTNIMESSDDLIHWQIAPEFGAFPAPPQSVISKDHPRRFYRSRAPGM